MASTGIISGDTNGLRTSEVHPTIRLMTPTRAEISVACESM
ncbi:MAG: hypothetical protein E5299_01511 [Burkholderia gladioli]|nr:MAG: hypothetical protein E5299_01511 [Burkholderia gladioli]